jgi:DNA adenine methylase
MPALPRAAAWQRCAGGGTGPGGGPRQLPRPFLKWAGGKAGLAEELLRRAPAAFGSYFEPFVGSGALFFRLLRRGLPGSAHLSDANAELVDAYLAVRDHLEPLVGLLERYPHSAEFYYALRAQDPAALDLPARAARTIYLNKTGYNGLYRVNRRGQFNVPFGRYESPRYCDTENLRAVSAALRGIDIRCAPFESVLERAVPGDLVYFDPPYAPLSATACFTAYQAGGFSAADQARLRDVCAELARRGVHVMLSNSDTELVHALYGAPPFRLDRVQAGRAINSNAARRGRITELIVTGDAPA